VYVDSAELSVHAAAEAAGFERFGPGSLHADDAGLMRDGDGTVVGRNYSLSSAGDVEHVLKTSQRSETVLVDPVGDWRIIPLEALIAARFARLLVLASSAEAALLYLAVLEAGADGVVLRTDDAEEVLRLAVALQESPTCALREAVVTRVEEAGLCDRACVDTASILRPDEGLLLGCFAGGLFLVLSEAAPSEFIESRPFRINAGAVAAYCLAPGGRSAYLSELRAGARVLVVDALGHSREETVARIKLERRPAMLVEAEADGRRFCALLQHAETVRLAAAGGGSIPVTRLAPGDRVLISLQAAARHTGVAVEEACTER